jgi:hypothetical protein
MIKQRKHIQFKSEYHTYTNVVTDEKYCSGTRFISHFHKEFNPDEIAYNLITNHWKYIERFEGMETKEAVEILKAEWAKRAEIGNYVHDILEKYMKGNEVIDSSMPQSHNDRITQLIIAYDKLELKKQYANYEFYPELLVFNDEYKIAGQSDLVLFNKHNKTFIVYDYKTNQKGISKKAFGGATMYDPISHLADCNYIHYTLQLSLYAYCLELEMPEYKCEHLGLFWIDTNNKQKINIEEIGLEYKKDEIEIMLRHYQNLV